MRIAIAAAAAASTWCGIAGAQAAGKPATDGAPRIGLALSGGGARGLAHVGVLKVLDELRVPVHCVTGTSMGAIVGATFAAGRTPAEMEKLVLAADWDAIFRDQPPRAEIAVRRKLDDFKTLFAPEYGIGDDGLKLPKGLIAGVSIESFFRDLAAPSFSVTDFDKLPIPFRAMATDIETGESVVMKDGSLSQAMRASMSVPGALTPVERDGRLLVDGGIANNLPIDEARRLCGDVVIAVNISTPPYKRSELTSALSVSSQLINFLGKQTVDAQIRSLGDRDVLVAPELGDISSSSFDRGADAIRIGEEATRAVADRLARYSLPPERYAEWRSDRQRSATDLGTVDEIRVDGLQRTNPEVVSQLVDSRPGEPLTEAQVGGDLRRIFGTRDYESISYRLFGDGVRRTLAIEPVEKAWGPDYLRFGLGLATDFEAESQFNLLVQVRRTWLNSLGAEWVTEAQIGQTTSLSTELFQPLSTTGPWFIAPSAAIGRTVQPVYLGDSRFADYLTNVGTVSFDAGVTLGTWGLLRAGPSWGRVDAEVETGLSVLPAVRERTAGARASLFIDQTDAAWFPRSGYGVFADAYAAREGLGSDREYERVHLAVRAIRSWGPHTLNLELSGGSSLGSTLPGYEYFTLGGPLRLSGYRIDEFAGDEYAFGRVQYYNRTIPLPDLLGLLGSGFYVGLSAEVGRINGGLTVVDPPGTLWSGSLFLGADTFFGPVYAGIGYGKSENFRFFLLIGAP